MNESNHIEDDENLEGDEEIDEEDDFDDEDDRDDEENDEDDRDEDEENDEDDRDDDRDDGEDETANATPDTLPSGRRRQGKGRRPERSIEPPDEQSRLALEFVDEVIEHMQLRCSVHLRDSKDPENRDIRLEVTGQDAARIIGKRGQVLGALQFLANRALNRPGEERRYVTVDAEGYRSRRDNSLAAMAKRLGKQAVNDGKIITFEPMPPRDRRLVHLALAKFDGVITKSEGEGEDRRVQIIPVRRSGA